MRTAKSSVHHILSLIFERLLIIFLPVARRKEACADGGGGSGGRGRVCRARGRDADSLEEFRVGHLESRSAVLDEALEEADAEGVFVG